MRADPPFLAVAHRFGNALERLRRAEAAGAHLVEADVWLHRGRLEVRHSKTMGPIPLLWDRWSLEPASRPRLSLEALVRASAPATELMLDLKGTAFDLPRRVIREMERIAPGRPYAVCSQGWRLLAPFEPFPHVRVIHSVGNRRALRAVLQRLSGEPHHAISINQRFLDTAVVRDLRQAAPTVMTWPINSLQLLRQVEEWGVTGAITDRLDVVRAIVGAQAEPGRGSYARGMQSPGPTSRE